MFSFLLSLIQLLYFFIYLFRYQLYDGTLLLSGCKILLQHRIKIDEEKIQILPPEQRSFPFQPPNQSVDVDVDEETIAGIIADSIDMSCVEVDIEGVCSQGERHGESQEKSQEEAKVSSKKREQNCECECDRLWETLTHDGFAYVRGTGMSRQVCEEALEMTSKYFVDASEKVRRSCLGKERSLRGYSPMNTENTRENTERNTENITGLNDCVKKFRMGNESDDGGGAASDFHQSNVWPNPELWEYANQFRSSVSEYYDQMRSMSTKILAMILDGMKKRGHAANARRIMGSNKEVEAETTNVLTLLGYKGKKRNARKKKKESRPLVAAHTDIGIITIRLYEPTGDCAKLQRRRNVVVKGSTRGSSSEKSKEWVDVILPPLNDDPMFLVNIGTGLSEMTQGTLQSRENRVVLTGGTRERQCLAMFVSLNPQSSM